MLTDFQKTKIFINEGYEKLLLDYKNIESQFDTLLHNISSDYKSQILNINKELQSMKDSFKLFIASINEQISSLETSHDSSTNNSDISKSLTITPRMKSSYDMISNEFDKVEKITKDIITSNQNVKEKREKRIILLEKQLQQYCEDVKKVNFSILEKEYENLTSNYNNKQIISNYITKNSTIEKYTLLGYDDSNSIQSEDFYAQQSKHFNTSLHNEKTESDEANNTIVNEIIKNNPTKGEEMIQLIESILSHSNKKKKC